MAGPGWYPDPYDPRAEQYYDGQQWSGARRPAAPVASSAAAYEPSPYSPPFYPPQYQADYAAVDGDQPPAASRARRSRTRWWLVIGVCAVVGLLAVGGWLFFVRDTGTGLTYQGHRIDHPERALESAQTTVDSLVRTRHGASGADTRCYFARTQTAQSAQAKKSDVTAILYCGPVLFVDGDAGRPYLTFGLTSSPVTDGAVTLTAAPAPISAQPVAVDFGTELVRPDGRTAPNGAGGVSVPAPPAAGEDVLTIAELGSSSIPAAPSGAVMVSYNGGVRLAKLGRIERYGTGDDARSAPPGQQLIAFETGDVPGEGNGIDDDALSVSVEGGAARPFPAGGGARTIVLSVPSGATTADLIMNDQGVEQRLSLLDGTPGPTNIAVLTRAVFTTPLAVTLPVNITAARAGQSGTEAITVKADRAALEFWIRTSDGRLHRPSRTTQAFLVVNLTFTDSAEPGAFGVYPEWLRFTPRGGATVRASNLLAGTDRVLNVFEVPANLTDGTVTITGSVAQGGGTLTVATPKTIAVRIPAR